MKAIVTALIALSVIAGIATPASAFDVDVFSGRPSVQQDRMIY